MNNSCKELFEKETKALLTRILMPDENISQGDDYDFFTTSGIIKLEIPQNSHIEIKYIGEDNLQAFRQIIIPKNNKVSELRELRLSSLFIICNLTSKRINNLLRRLPIGNEINVISIDDLRNAELSLFSNSSESQTSDWPVIKPDKSIQYEQFDDFLLSLIRLEIIMDSFSKGNATMQNIIAQKDSLLPFIYEDYLGQSHVFISENSRYTKHSILFDENAIVHKVEFNLTENGTTMLTIDGNSTVFRKISINWFGKSISFFNSYARINVLPNKPQFKYRKFGKSSLGEFDIIDPDYKYTRKVIEDKEIYFSTKSQLNDPFDLDADYIGKAFDFTSDNYRIFCTTGDNDNILMWSHYGDSHYGYCTSYYPFDIISEIEKENKIEFCIYGYVDYSPKRKTDSKLSGLIVSFFDKETVSFILQINQLFKKFDEWAYEKEFRYIICLNNHFAKSIASKDGISINVPPADYYFGQKFDFNAKTMPYLKKHIGDSCFKFNLSKTEYKLELSEEKL